MKAIEKKNLFLKLLEQQTFRLPDDYSVSIVEYDYNISSDDDKKFRLRFFANDYSFFSLGEIKSIATTAEVLDLLPYFKTSSGAPIVEVSIF